jgi:predicted DNA-binding transcriptional regulator AlpA
MDSASAVAISTDRLLNPKQVADRLGVSERWVRDHASRRSPRIAVVRLGPLVRFRVADIETFLENQRDDHSGTSRRKR